MVKLKWVSRKRGRRTLNLKRSDYLDHNTYARDVLRSGGPGPDDIGHLGGGSGLHSQILSIVWGASLAEFDAMCAAELEQEQRRRPHIFVRKWVPPRRPRRR
jgi:hypothetical protein